MLTVESFSWIEWEFKNLALPVQCLMLMSERCLSFLTSGSALGEKFVLMPTARRRGIWGGK